MGHGVQPVVPQPTSGAGATHVPLQHLVLAEQPSPLEVQAASASSKAPPVPATPPLPLPPAATLPPLALPPPLAPPVSPVPPADDSEFSRTYS